MQGCGVDTSQPVGTIFSIQYALVSEDGALASANRTITILEPCPSGESLCPDDMQCSAVACDLRWFPAPSGTPPTPRPLCRSRLDRAAALRRSQLSPTVASAEPPVLSLAGPSWLDDLAVVRAERGLPWNWTIMPCSALEGGLTSGDVGCGAVAVDGDGLSDISSGIQVLWSCGDFCLPSRICDCLLTTRLVCLQPCILRSFGVQSAAPGADGCCKSLGCVG